MIFGNTRSRSGREVFPFTGRLAGGHGLGGERVEKHRGSHGIDRGVNALVCRGAFRIDPQGARGLIGIIVIISLSVHFDRLGVDFTEIAPGVIQRFPRRRIEIENIRRIYADAAGRVRIQLFILFGQSVFHQDPAEQRIPVANGDIRGFHRNVIGLPVGSVADHDRVQDVQLRSAADDLDAAAMVGRSGRISRDRGIQHVHRRLLADIEAAAEGTAVGVHRGVDQVQMCQRIVEQRTRGENAAAQRIIADMIVVEKRDAVRGQGHVRTAEVKAAAARGKQLARRRDLRSGWIRLARQRRVHLFRCVHQQLELVFRDLDIGEIRGRIEITVIHIIIGIGQEIAGGKGFGAVIVFIDLGIFDRTRAGAGDIHPAAGDRIVVEDQRGSQIGGQGRHIVVQFPAPDRTVDRQGPVAENRSGNKVVIDLIQISFTVIKSAAPAQVVFDGTGTGVGDHRQRCPVVRDRHAVQGQVHARIRIDAAAETARRIMETVARTDRHIAVKDHRIQCQIIGQMPKAAASIIFGRHERRRPRRQIHTAAAAVGGHIVMDIGIMHRQSAG